MPNGKSQTNYNHMKIFYSTPYSTLILNPSSVVKKVKRLKKSYISFILISFIFIGFSIQPASGTTSGSGYKNLSKEVLSLPSMVKDEAIKNKIAQLPLVTSFYTYKNAFMVNDRGCEKKIVDINKYIDILGGPNFICNPEGLPTFEKLKGIPHIYSKIEDTLNKIKNKTSSEFIKEISDSDNNYFAFSVYEENRGDPNNSALLIVCKSGLIMVSTGENNIPAVIIPRDVLQRVSKINKIWRQNGEGVAREWINDGAEIVAGGIKYDVRSMSSNQDLDFKLYQAINYYNALNNIDIISHALSEKNSVSDANTEKLMGYSGLSIGMPEDQALGIIRNSIDYTTYEGLIEMNCQTADKINQQQWGNDAKKYLTDIEVATRGLIITPPWKLFIVKPKSFDDRYTFDNHYKGKLPSGDIFVFTDSKLCVCGK